MTTNTISLKSSSQYQTFLANRTIFGITDMEKTAHLDDVEKKVDDYISYLTTNFPSTANGLKELREEYRVKLDEAINRDYNREKIQFILIEIFKHPDITDLLRDEAQKKIDELFKKPVALNFHQVDETTIRRFKRKISNENESGADEIIFLTNFLGEEIFLNHIPAELQKELEKNPRTNFSRIDQTKWNTYRNNLLFKTFDNFPSTLDKEEDLAEMEKEINKVYSQFLELIKEVKQSQNNKPDELIGQAGSTNQGEGDGTSGVTGSGGSQNTELGQTTQNALITDPKTGENWDPELTDDEKAVINDPNLNTKGAIQAAAFLLSHLKSIQKDNGDSKDLTKWNTAEEIKKAIQTFQSSHYNNLDSYKKAATDSDKNKAWKAVNTNTKLNNIAENVHQRYWKLICNVEDHQKLVNQTQITQAILNAANEVDSHWNKAILLNKENKTGVLGTNWIKGFENKELAGIETEKSRLTKKIEEAQESQRQEQLKNEKQIQDAINKTLIFFLNTNLPTEERYELLKELETYKEWGSSSDHTKWLAVVNKNKEELGEKSLNKVIENLRIRIVGEESINTISQILSVPPRLEAVELGNEYAGYATKLRNMKTIKEINDYENKALVLDNTIRPIRAKLNRLVDSAKEIIDTNNNSPEVQKKRENVLNLIFELEKFADPNADELTKSVYARVWRMLDNFIDLADGKLYIMARKQASDRLNKKVEALKKAGVIINQNELTSCQQSIEKATSQELQTQKHENEFLIKVLSQQTEARIQQK